MAEKTPEKRLLEIIEGKDPGAIRPSPIKRRRKYFSFDAVRSRMAFFKDNVRRGADKRNTFEDLKSVNLFLQTVIGIAVIALIVTIGIESRNLNKTGLTVSSAEANVVVEPEEITSLLKDRDFYIKKAQDRDIFQMGYTKRAKVDFKEDEKNAKAAPINDLTKDLKLVGISWGDDPDAIIENSEMDKTYFVREGYKIEELLVSEIQKDRVVLRYKGEEVEIR